MRGNWKTTLVNARVWAERGSSLHGFIFLFVGEQMQTSTWPNHVQDFESCNL